MVPPAGAVGYHRSPLRGFPELICPLARSHTLARPAILMGDGKTAARI
jgi:hypothetical protein